MTFRLSFESRGVGSANSWAAKTDKKEIIQLCVRSVLLWWERNIIISVGSSITVSACVGDSEATADAGGQQVVTR